MAVNRPSSTELAKIAADLGFHFDSADVLSFQQMMKGALEAYSALDRLPDALPAPRYERLPGHISAAEDNHFGAYQRIIAIAGAPSGFGLGPSGVYLPSAMQRLAMWRHQADRLSEPVKLGMLVGAYMSRAYGGGYCGRAHNLARLLADSYDRALANVDLLAAPTLTLTAAKATESECGARGGRGDRLWHDDQYGAVQCHGQFLDELALRLDRRAAGRADADRTPFRRAPNVSRCRGIGAKPGAGRHHRRRGARTLAADRAGVLLHNRDS
jgi:hypothetical protein